MTDAAAKGSALGQGNKFYDVFGQDMTTGNPMGGAINPIGSANGNFTMSLNNLSAGTYTLTMLVGRGTITVRAILLPSALTAPTPTFPPAWTTTPPGPALAERRHRHGQHAYRRLDADYLHV